MKSYEFAIEAQKLKRSWAFRCIQVLTYGVENACLQHLETGPPSFYKAFAQLRSLHFCVDLENDIDWFYSSTAPPPQPLPQILLDVFSLHVRMPNVMSCQGEDIKSLMELVVDRMARAPGFEQ